MNDKTFVAIIAIIFMAAIAILTICAVFTRDTPPGKPERGNCFVVAPNHTAYPTECPRG